MIASLNMKSLRLIFAGLLGVLWPAFGAEIPFEKAEEFPAGAYELIAEKRIIWLGELHGTREAPRLFLGLVRLVAAHDKAPPVVALELPATEQRAIDRFLASGDEAILRGSPFFKSEIKDGRSSVAMVELLTRLRTGKKTAVFCFDAARAASPQERDTAMAKNLRTCSKKYPKSKLVVLSGGVHASLESGTSWDPAYRPAACELNQPPGTVVSFTLAYEGGTMWALTERGFAEQPVTGPRWSGKAPHYITLYPARTRGHDGAIFTRTLTGSPAW
jgi:erythromycin esterase-like protein